MTPPSSVPKLPPLAVEVQKQIRYAQRPPRFPRGYFDSLVTPSRELLDKGLRIHEAADWFIKHGVFPVAYRRRFIDAMKSRLSRLRQKEATDADAVSWRSSFAYDSAHAVAKDAVTALCGARTTLWTGVTPTSHRCARCLGISRRHGISVAED